MNESHAAKQHFFLSRVYDGRRDEGFRLGSSMHGDYHETLGSVGGRPSNKMTFFRVSEGRTYRIFSPREVVLIGEPAAWISRVIDAGQPNP